MSILNRKLTAEEKAAIENEPTPVADETFTHVFAVDRGELIVDPDDTEPPVPKRVWPAVALWVATLGATVGSVFYFAGGGL